MNIIYLNPLKANQAGKGHIHELRLLNGRESVAYAQMLYRNDNFPYYYIASLFVEKGYRGNGFGKSLFLTVNQFLDEKKASGLLVKSIDEGHPAHNLYQKNGWTEVPQYPYWYIRGNIKEKHVSKAIHKIDKMFQ